jgi:hypothetical protein
VAAANPSSRLSWDIIEVIVGQQLIRADFYQVEFDDGVNSPYQYHVDGNTALFANTFPGIASATYSVRVRGSLKEVFTDWSDPIVIEYTEFLPIKPQNVKIT